MKNTIKAPLVSFLLATTLVLTGCDIASSGPKGPKMDVKVNVPNGESDLQLFQIIEPPIIDYSLLTVEKRKGRRDCAINRPSSGAKIVNINTRGSMTRRGSPINAVKAYYDSNTEEWDYNVNPYHRTKIVITDTSAPIYIVIGTYRNTIWEIFAAPGVKLDGMFLVGHHSQAVVNSNISSSRISFISVSDPLHKKCYEAVRDPGTTTAGSKSERWKEYQEWRRYISRKMLRPPTDVINDSSIDAVLIGPVPDFALPGTYTDNKIIRHDADDRTLIFNHYDFAEAQAEAWIAAGKTDF